MRLLKPRGWRRCCGGRTARAAMPTPPACQYWACTATSPRSGGASSSSWTKRTRSLPSTTWCGGSSTGWASAPWPRWLWPRRMRSAGPRRRWRRPTKKWRKRARRWRPRRGASRSGSGGSGCRLRAGMIYSKSAGNRDTASEAVFLGGLGVAKRTRTSTFGSSRRESHDSSTFYNRSSYQVPPEPVFAGAFGSSGGARRSIPPRPLDEFVDRVYCHTAEDMYHVPDASVALAFTSPPYNVGKDYDADLSLSEYLDLITRVGREVYRVLKPGGRYVVN